jgi:hydroxymethylpyrimidine pyrophosphatase-like HAD family hydrolase
MMSTIPFLLAADVDGTLLGDAEGEARFKEFVQAHGGAFRLAVITGRYPHSVLKLVEEGRLPQPDFICGNVGTELIDCRDSTNTLGLKYAARASSEWSLEKVYTLGVGEGIWLQDFGDAQPPFQAGFFWDGKAESLEAMRQRLSDHHQYRILPSYGEYVDVLPTGFGKGETVRFLQQELGIDPGRVVVAGDSGNDAEMFQTEYQGILPANALDELVASACPPRHYRSPFPAGRGVLDGLQHFGFMEGILLGG